MGAQVSVDFDAQLTPAVLDVPNWFVRWGGNQITLTAAAAGGFPFGARVLLTKGLTVGSPGPNVVSFSPPPFDVTALVGGAPAVAFANFPLLL
jgi:hypothetical protein